MMSDLNLEPCVFCGGAAGLTIGESPEYFWVTCVDGECSVDGPSMRTQAEAIRAWNHPYALESQATKDAARIAELESLVEASRSDVLKYDQEMSSRQRTFRAKIAELDDVETCLRSELELADTRIAALESQIAEARALLAECQDDICSGRVGAGFAEEPHNSLMNRINAIVDAARPAQPVTEEERT